MKLILCLFFFAFVAKVFSLKKLIPEEWNPMGDYQVFSCGFRISFHCIIWLILHIWCFCNIIVNYIFCIWGSLIVMVNCFLKYSQLLYVFISDKLTGKHMSNRFTISLIMEKSPQAFQNCFLKCFILMIPFWFFNEVLYTS